MSAIDRFDSDIGGALADLARPHYPDYFDSVLERAMEADQRPAWTFPERWLPMGVIALKSTLVPRWPWRRVGFVVALLALILAAALYVVGTGRPPAPPFGLANNGNVIYVVEGDIYARPVGGNVGRLLVSGPEMDVSPIYSRDGTKFAIVRIHEETETGPLASLLVANADGSNLHTVAGPELEPHWWEWSPDSTEIAIATKDAKFPPLSIVNVDGEPVRRAVDVPFQRDSTILWRPPDGGELIVIDRTGSHASLELVNADGSDHRPIVNGPIYGPFSFTPDGRFVTYQKLQGDALRLSVLDLDTATERPLGMMLPALVDPGSTTIHVADGRLTPEGERIVFARLWDERDGVINRQLWVMRLEGDGSDAYPVTEIIRSRTDTDPFFELVSPDGTTLLYRNVVTEEAVSVDLSDGSTTSLDWITSELTDWQRLAP